MQTFDYYQAKHKTETKTSNTQVERNSCLKNSKSSIKIK